MTQWHVDIFLDPVSAPAKRLAELRERRRHLRGQAGDADRERTEATRERDGLKQRAADQQARELALGKAAGTPTAKTLAGQLAKAEARIERLDRDVARFAAAVDAIDGEMGVYAREHQAELEAELTSAYDAAVGRYAEALRALETAAIDAKQAATRMAWLIERTRPEVGHELREIAPNRTIHDLVASARDAIPGSVWLNSAHDRWAHEEHLRHVADAREQVDAEVQAGERELRSEVYGSDGTDEAIRDVMDDAGWTVLEVDGGGSVAHATVGGKP